MIEQQIYMTTGDAQTGACFALLASPVSKARLASPIGLTNGFVATPTTVGTPADRRPPLE